MARAFALLLPPSEGKAPGGRGAPWRPGRGVLPALDGPRAEVLAALGGGVAEAPTRRALDRYTGVLYKELDAASLDTAARRRLSSTTLIASGLWGLVGPNDPIPDYRLKMGASLPGLGKLSTFWRPHLTAALGERLAGRVVWDLLPNEHAAAWDPAPVPLHRRITVRFVTAQDTTVSHWNKLLKGSLVRHLAATGLTDPDGLAAFAHPSGYRYDPAATVTAGRHTTIVLRES
ncbi:MAG TPA: peroxide stress protein YaaA [Iamia sp.]|nr:peroxide stress protein YaaA [Iamia sp.]